MSSVLPIVELRNARLSKVEKLREKGINAYPSRSHRTHYTKEIVNNFDAFEGQTVTVAGRLMAFRDFGKLSFGPIQDQTGRIQLYLRQDTLTSEQGAIAYEDLHLLDVGDFIEATGKVTKTQRGEISVAPVIVRILTKSLRPLPDKWAGLKDREAILRRRYLDTTFSPEHKEVFEKVGQMLFAIRRFLYERGFIEFQTPIIQPQYGGGTAKPFLTHVNALDTDMFLAISHELYLKRLIAAGYDKVFTIGRYFRNEGIDRSHHPEFSMIETMTAYENYEYNMDLIEAMFRYIAETVFAKTLFEVRGHKIDFGEKWKRISMADAVQEVTGLDFRDCQSVDEANDKLISLGVNEPQATIGLAIAKAFEAKVEETLINPTFIYGHPLDISPLAKPMDDNPNFVERFEIFIAGMECGDNWSEQNDPVALLERWQSAINVEELDEEKFHPLDYDFIEMLEHGMPPTTGIGPGIERMAMIFTGEEDIYNIIFFPMMKPVLSQANAAIFGIDELPRFGFKEDVLLAQEEFESLLAAGVLQPESAAINLRLHLRLWEKPTTEGNWKATGYLEASGFLKNKRLKISGYSAEAKEKLNKAEALKAYKQFAIQNFIVKVKEKFSDCKVRFEED
ncbi:MAG: lysine--tRNA ligase [Acidobacteria bacterium]|nr:lysine--tRNA ligase [Acidobacteriota bacterium]